VTGVALANKNARVMWASLTRNQVIGQAGRRRPEKEKLGQNNRWRTEND
jgi:hypothetical protein